MFDPGLGNDEYEQELKKFISVSRCSQTPETPDIMTPPAAKRYPNRLGDTLGFVGSYSRDTDKFCWKVESPTDAIVESIQQQKR
eukprot:UN30164